MKDDPSDFRNLSPATLRKLPVEQLEFLAEEIRQRIISTCFKNGGHLGASLGAVEIAIALHFVFDSPSEPLVWDVGHQAYAHKLLTGRWESFATLRQKNGISGFLSRKESEHDPFGAGHSSTALSAALAMAWARRKRAADPAGGPTEGKWTVAIVGDGGLTAGLSFEALNNFKNLEIGPFLLVLNDNQMSIARNSGAIATMLPHQQEAAAFFEALGFEYFGPIDGHDLRGMINALREIRSAEREKPAVLHLFTQKGRGYIPAEEQPETFHGVSPVRMAVQSKIETSPLSGDASRAGHAAKGKSYSEVFGEALCSLAEKDPRIVAITAAMPEGTGLGIFARRFPDRFFDVGIAEQHAVTFAAGLATQGYRPVVAVYSTFLQRALDSIIHDVALQGLGVVFAVDRAGIVGADGPTHHGCFDLSFFGMIPGMHLSSPACLEDLPSLLQRAVQSDEPWAIRYPRGSGLAALPEACRESGGLRFLKEAAEPALIVVAAGNSIHRALEGMRSLDRERNGRERISLLSVVDIKPLPVELLRYISAHPEARVCALEDGVASGGFGQRLLAELGPRPARFEIAAYGDHFMEQGSPEQLEELERVSARGLAERFEKLLD